MRTLRKHLRRLRQWSRVARMEARRAKLLPFLRWLISGERVSPAVYRHRLFVCKSCPIFDRKNLRCRAPAPHAHLGCGCFVPFVALAPAPYSGTSSGRKLMDPETREVYAAPIAGCWGYVTMGGRIGWPDALPASLDSYHLLTQRVGPIAPDSQRERLLKRTKWRCTRCRAEVTGGRCKCATSPSPWEPVV